MKTLVLAAGTTAGSLACGCHRGPVEPAPVAAVLAPAIGSKYLAGRDTIEVRYTPPRADAAILFSFHMVRDSAWDTMRSLVRVNDSTVRFTAPGRYYSDSATVMVAGIGDNGAGVQSPGFSVKRLMLRSPVDGASYRVGDTLWVSWDTTTAAASQPGATVVEVKVRLSVDDGLSFEVLGGVFPDDTLGRWSRFPVVIGQPTQKAIVDVSDYFFGDLYDRNRVPFSVR